MYPSQEVGKGFFLRGDVGIAKLAMDTNIPGVDLTSDAGFGILLGGGYSFQVAGSKASRSEV